MPRWTPLRQPTRRRAATLVLAAAGLLAGGPTAQAQTDYYWNPGGATGGTPAGGTGDWDTTTPNWSTSASTADAVTWSDNTGTLRANFGGTAGTVTLTEAITAYGLNFTATGYTITGNTLTLAGAGGVVDTGAFDATVNSILGGGVGLTKTGTGTLVLGGANPYTGATLINAGVVAVSTATGLGATGTGNTTTVASGAALQLSGGITLGEAITINGNGVLAGGALRNTSGANTITAAFTVASAARINSNAGSLTITGLVSTSGSNLTVGGAGDVQIGATGNTTTNTLSIGAGTLAKDGAGTLTVTGANTSVFTGPINVTGGVLSIVTNSALGPNGTITLDGGTLRNTNPATTGNFVTASRTINVGPAGGTVDYSGSTTATLVSLYSGTITGPGGTLTKTGPNEFRYQGTGLPNTTYSKLVVKQGLFRLGFASSTSSELGFGAAPATFTADAITLDGGGIGTSFVVTLNANRGITLGAGGGFFENSAGSMTVPGVISGVGSLSKPSTGTLTFAAANTYQGTTTISGGSITTSVVNALPSTTALTITSTANATGLTLSGNNQTIGSLAGGGATTGNISLGAAVLTTGGNNTSTSYIGVISGTGGLTKDGTGTFTLGGANTYTGATTVTAGTLAISAAERLANGSALSVASGATFDLTGGGAGNFNETVASVSGVGNITLGSATLTTTGAASTTFGGTLAGASGSLAKQGTGTLTLSGASTYGGATTVTAGTLTITNVTGSATGTSTVTVGNNATNTGTFRGTGSVAGPLSVINGGTLAPGLAAGVGRLSTTGNATFATGATLTARVNGAAAAGTDYDQFAVGGAFDAGGGTLTITSTATSFNPGDVVSLVTFGTIATTGGVPNTFLSQPDGSTVAVGNYTATINYGTLTGFSNAVTLTNFAAAAAVPEPGAALAFAALATGLAGRIRRRPVAR